MDLNTLIITIGVGLLALPAVQKFPVLAKALAAWLATVKPTVPSETITVEPAKSDALADQLTAIYSRLMLDHKRDAAALVLQAIDKLETEPSQGVTVALRANDTLFAGAKS